MCIVYIDSELQQILDWQLPLQLSTAWRQSTDPWFDSECWVAKEATRRIEQVYAAVVAVFRMGGLHRIYFRPLCCFCGCCEGYMIIAAPLLSPAAPTKVTRLLVATYWERSVESVANRRHKLPPSTAIDVHQFRMYIMYFDERVSRIRTTTAHPPPLTFSDVPEGVNSRVCGGHDSRRRQLHRPAA